MDAVQSTPIDPAIKILYFLKILAFGVSPAVFQDYFHIGLTAARQRFIQFTKVMSRNNILSQK
jgi:hypothetical protein